METCPRCHGKNIVGIEYRWDHPEHYDGISEYYCTDCNYRQGRWSGKELKDGQYERSIYRFGHND